MLLFPFIQEQHINAARVEELGVGIYCKQRIKSREELIILINKILGLGNDYYRKNAQIVRKSLVDAGGLKMAVNYILSFVKRQN